MPDPFDLISEWESEVENTIRERKNVGQNNNLYTINNNDDSTGYCAVQSVLKNKEGFTKKQVERANCARSGYFAAGAPDMKAFKLAVRSGLFKDCGIEEEDISNADKIYGPSVAVLKGKTKRSTPDAVVNNWIEIPEELVMNNMELDLCIDLLFINNVVALTGVDKQVKYRHYIDIPNRMKKSLYSAIDEIFRIYNHADFSIRAIYCDREFRPLFEGIKDDLGIHMNYTSAGEHEPVSERNNQHIKSLVQTQFHQTPYKAIPKLMTASFGRNACRTSNYYPAKGGISQYYSPQMIILKQKVDFAKECVVEPGSYVQGYGHETHRNQKTRTVDAIYLGPASNIQGGHVLMDLTTGKKCERKQVKVLPITSQVIKLVETLAAAEGVKSIKTYSRRTGAVILDADLLTGVEPDELWDQDSDSEDEPYNPNDDTPPISDSNLRIERIDTEEVNDLIDDAADDFVISEGPDDLYEEEVINRIVDRIKRKKRIENEEDSDDEEYELVQPPEDDLPLETDNKTKEEMMDELAMELKELEDEEKSTEIQFEKENESSDEDYDSEDENILLKDLPRLAPHHGNDSDNDSDDDDDNDDNDENNDNNKGMFGSRTHFMDTGPSEMNQERARQTQTKLRSGKSFWQNGKRMRPLVRNGRD